MYRIIKHTYIMIFLMINSVISQEYELKDSQTKITFENSIGVGGNLTFLTMNDLRPNNTDSKVSYNSISMIGNSKIKISNSIINVRISVNYSPYNVSTLSLGNYTYLNNKTNEVIILPLTGTVENENISFTLGLGSEIELYKSLYLRGYIIQLETTYNNKLNLYLDNKYSGFTAYNSDRKTPENVEIFNYDNQIDLLVSFGASLFYNYEINKALISKMEIELGVLLKTFQFEEFDHISQLQLSVLFYN